MKVTSVNTLTSGQKNGREWHLVVCQFEGKDGEHKGFVSFVPNVGDDLNVEFSQEEYKGEMENRFKVLSKAAQKQAEQQKVAEMAIKTHIDAWMSKISHDLKVIQERIGVDPQGKPYPYPSNQGIDIDKSGEVPEDTEDELKPEDIPFEDRPF